MTRKEQGMAQWWEHSPPTHVARVQISASTPYVGWVCCWFSSLLREGFFPGTPVFPSPQKLTFPNSNSTRNKVDEEPLCGNATSKSLFIYYLFMLLLVTKKENKTETKKQTNKQRKTLAARVKEKMKKQTDHFRVSPSLCFDPLSPNIHIQILQFSWKNLIKYQRCFSLWSYYQF